MPLDALPPVSPAIPLWLVSALVIETLVDVSLASPVFTAALIIAHMTVLRFAARLG